MLCGQQTTPARLKFKECFAIVFIAYRMWIMCFLRARNGCTFYLLIFRRCCRFVVFRFCLRIECLFAYRLSSVNTFLRIRKMRLCPVPSVECHLWLGTPPCATTRHRSKRNETTSKKNMFAASRQSPELSELCMPTWMQTIRDKIVDMKFHEQSRYVSTVDWHFRHTHTHPFIRNPTQATCTSQHIRQKYLPELNISNTH